MGITHKTRMYGFAREGETHQVQYRMRMSSRNVGAHSEKLMFSLHCKIKSWQIRSEHLPVDEGSGPQTWRDSSKRND
jgi:hypothetical protein